MTIFQAFVLGIIQGLTEFLPISSSAHLLLTPYLLGWETQSLAFDLALHVGTLMAVLWFFWSDWVRLTRAFVSLVVTRRIETADQRMFLLIAGATIPALIAGAALRTAASTTFREELAVSAAALIVFGIILWLTDRLMSRERSLDSLRARDALIIGVAQALALVPGVSRSGATITAGRLLRLDRGAAARFSFLMSMPVTAIAAAMKVPEALAEGGLSAPLVVGVLASAATGWVAISVLLRFLTRHGYGVFAAYRVGFGVLVLYVLLSRG